MLKYLYDLDLNLLVTFRVFVESGSMAATATELGLSQPAISGRLKALQEEMGAVLLERHGRRLRLTSVGRSLDERLAGLLGGMADSIEEARSAGDEPVGRLRLGVLPTAHVHVLAPRLAALSKAYPRLTLELLPGHVAPHLRALRDGNIDAVLGIGEPPVQGLLVDVLSEARAVVVTPRGCFENRPSRADLRSQRWLGYGVTGDPFFDSVQRFMVEAGLHTNVALQVAHIASIKALIASGAGIAVLPDYTVADDPRFSTHTVRGLNVRLPVWLAVRQGSAGIPAVAVLRAFASGTAGDSRLLAWHK